MLEQLKSVQDFTNNSSLRHENELRFSENLNFPAKNLAGEMRGSNNVK